MRMTALHAPTLKEAPKEAEVPSHALLLRAGYLRKEAAGIYSFLPLAMKVLARIGRIVREELDRAGAQEVLLPLIQPAELWQESGRWTKYGPELLRIKDRKDAEFCFSPTAEELIVSLVRRDVRSYRQLPLNLYQIATKFRDEVRPRAGLLRGREFIMKDAYSFDADEAAAGRTYQAMYDAYTRIFQRCGLEFRPVEADTGAIGGSRSHEFQVLAETGEDSIVSCSQCTYTANVEKAELLAPSASDAPATAVLRRVDTPGKRTVEDVAAFLGTTPSRLAKTLLVVADGKPVAALVRGDHELNLVKLKAHLGATEIELAGEALVRELTGADVGFAGPVGLPAHVDVVADPAVLALSAVICGANATDQHFADVVFGRDLPRPSAVDLRLAHDGDPCGRCGGAFRFFRGIEVGHVFFLGTKYSEPMGCTFLDQDGKERPMVMGCYGIGLTRIMAAAIEQNHDADGIKWPVPIAPHEVVVLPLNADDAEVLSTAERVYRELLDLGVSAVLDDRDMRPGAKFKDADLVGFPFQIVVGKRGLAEGNVEFKVRATGEKGTLTVAGASQSLTERIRTARGGA